MGARGAAGNGIEAAYIQGPLTVAEDDEIDFGCEPGDIAVGSGYKLANAGVTPLQIQPISTSGYQFAFTGGGADVWVSCLSTASPVARMARSGKAERPVTLKEEK